MPPLGPSFLEHDNAMQDRVIDLIQTLREEGHSWKNTLCIFVNAACYMHNETSDDEQAGAKESTAAFMLDAVKLLRRGRFTM